jgi:hypothetical protein
MFRKNLHTLFFLELSNKSRVPFVKPASTNHRKAHKERWDSVPEFRSNTEIFATSHKGITFTSLGSSSYSTWVKIILFPPRNTHKSTVTHESILPRYTPRRNNRLTPRRKTPPTRPKRSIQNPTIFDFREIYYPIFPRQNELVGWWYQA